MSYHRWRLNEIMGRFLIRPVDLADELQISNQSIGNLRNRLDMPKINGKRLVSICDALNRLIREKGETDVTITPADLIEYRFDDDAA